MKKMLLSLTAILPMLILSGCNMVVFEPQGPVARSITELINWSLIPDASCCSSRIWIIRLHRLEIS